jgi:Ca-activated chloride channel family protein
VKYKYTKYVPGIIDELDFDQLMSKLSDFFLSSGFGNPYDPLNEDDRTMQALHDAILDALLNGGMLSDEMINQLLSQNAEGKDAETRDALEQLIQQIIERLTDQGFISMGDQPASQGRVGPGGDGPVDPNARFEITDKALDFLGYRALRDILGAVGRSAAGRHDTRDLATGVDAGGAPREYEFGDTMNLDAATTILKSVQRNRGLGDGAHTDLIISQGEFQSSCATVIILDCSHTNVL